MKATLTITETANPSSTHEVVLTEVGTNYPVAKMLVSHRPDKETDLLDWVEVDPQKRGRGLSNTLMREYQKETSRPLYAERFTLEGLRTIAKNFLTEKEIKRRIMAGEFEEG